MSRSGAAAAAVAAACLAAPACWIQLDPSDKLACRSERDCLDGYQCIDQLCTSGGGASADARPVGDGGDGPPDGGPPDGGPPVDAALGCSFDPGGDGCVCGFRTLVPFEEWKGYEIDCEYFGDFCRADCCPAGTRVDAADPTRCVPEPGGAPELRYFGPWPDHADPISQMRLWWIAYGADTCTVTIAIDGGVPVVRDGQPGVGQLAIDELALGIDLAALEASLSCSNDAGPAIAQYSIPAADERVTVTGEGSGFPQEVQICWQVLPFLATTVPPYQGGGCEVGLCPAGVKFDPQSSVPCFDASFTRSFSEASGCVTSDVAASVGDRAYIACENGDLQRAVHERIIIDEAISRPARGALP